MKRILCLLGLLGTLAVVQPDGSVKVYATFPLGGTQMSLLDLDTGRTWMIRKVDAQGKTIEVIDYDRGETVRWNTADGCRKCGDGKPMEEWSPSEPRPRKADGTFQTERGFRHQAKSANRGDTGKGNASGKPQ